MPFKLLFSILTPILLLCSCVTNDRTLAPHFVTDDYILKAQRETFDVPLTNKASDSVQSSNSRHILVGNIADPLLGTVISGGASRILPYSDSTDFGKDPKLISAYLSLRIDSTFYLSDNQEGIHQNLYIYRLKNPLDSTKGFCTSITPDDYYPTPISRGIPVIYKSESIRIDLTDEFAKELLATTPEEFKDLDLFAKRINGFYIKTDDPMPGQEGGRLNFFKLGSSVIYLNYTMNDPDRNIVDLDTTESFAFGHAIAVNCFSTGSGSLESDDPADRLYVQSLSGLKPHIEAKRLKAMFNQWVEEKGYEKRTILLSRAELTFPYQMPEDYKLFDKVHPTYLYAFRNNPAATDTLRFYKPLEEVYNVVNKGKIDRSLEKYTLDVTKYLQELLSTDTDKITSDYNLWIAPLTMSVDNLNQATYHFDNSYYSRVILNGTGAERRPSLTITYTVMRD